MASEPASVAMALTNMGFEPELRTDAVGDPMIVARKNSAIVAVYFYGCDEAAHDQCQSVRLQVAFDRSEAWTAAEAMQLSHEMPFIAVRLDDEGDPFLHWDLVLGEGISEAVFRANVSAFAQSVDKASRIIGVKDEAADKDQP